MSIEEIALNIACDLLIGSNLYGYDYDRVFEELMERDGVVSSLSIKQFILDNVEELGKEYFVKEGEEIDKTETKKCPICGSDLYEYCFMCCYEGEKVKSNDFYN